MDGNSAHSSGEAQLACGIIIIFVSTLLWLSPIFYCSNIARKVGGGVTQEPSILEVLCITDTMDC